MLRAPSKVDQRQNKLRQFVRAQERELFGINFADTARDLLAFLTELAARHLLGDLLWMPN
jgi:hypothetical protein